MAPFLTPKQMRRILELVRKDARNQGYGTKYHMDNKREWPYALKQLESIAGKLMQQMEDTQEPSYGRRYTKE
jgi:hypothetical protein